MHCSPQKGPETLPAVFQGIRRSQGICFSRTSFVSFPIPILPDRNGIQEKKSRKKIPEVGGAHTYFRNTACAYWECGLASSVGLDWANGIFQFYVKESTRHPKLLQLCTLKEEESENKGVIYSCSCYVPLAT